MNKEGKFTIIIRPWMGAFGVLGLLGPILYYKYNNPNTLLLISFIAFFALYWEGKLSERIKSEKFIYNKLQAGDISEKIGLVGNMIIIFNAFSNSSIEGRYIYLIMGIPFILGVQIIVRSFLIYKYEKDT